MAKLKDLSPTCREMARYTFLEVRDGHPDITVNEIRKEIVRNPSRATMIAHEMSPRLHDRRGHKRESTSSAAAPSGAGMPRPLELATTMTNFFSDNAGAKFTALALACWMSLGAGPRIVEFGPTFRSSLGPIGFTPDGSTWIAESDGVARITRDGRIAQKRRPDDCPACRWSRTGLIVKANGTVESGGYTYRGTSNGGIAFAQQPAVSHADPRASRSYDVVARGADGATWSYVDSNDSQRSGVRKELVYKKGGVERRAIAKSYLASHQLTNILIARNDDLIASLASLPATYRAHGSTQWGATPIVRITADGVVSAYASVPNRGQWWNGIADWQMLADGTIWLTEAYTSGLARIDAKGSVTEFHAGIPENSALNHLAVDPGGNVWADDTFAGRVIRLAPDGTVRIFGNGLSPENMPGMPVPASDGGTWFFQTLSWHFRLTRLAPDGELREFPFPMPDLTCLNSDKCTRSSIVPELQTHGPDAVFLVQRESRDWPPEGWIPYAVSPDGRVTRETNDCFVAALNFVCEHGLPKLSHVEAAYAIAGPDNALWFSDPRNSRIGRADRAGHVVYYSRGLTRWHSGPQYMTLGPDGAIWFTEVRDRIGRISLTGQITEFSGKIPFRSFPGGIVTGADKNLWFTIYHGNELVRMTPSGVVTRFRDGISPSRGDDYATPNAYLQVGPDGRLWFNEPQGGRIAAASLPKPARRRKQPSL